ncbi:MAG: hypothetical protein AB7Y46_10985 [Armatimonadota bacterium]
MKRIAASALIVLIVALPALALTAAPVEGFGPAAQAFASALDGSAVVLADGASVALSIPIPAGTWRIAITAMATGDRLAWLESLTEGEIVGRHLVPAGAWGEVGIGVESATVGEAADIRLTAVGAQVALDEVRLMKLEEPRESLPLTSPGVIHRETPLIAAGRPVAMLLLPRAPEYRAVAEQFAARFTAATGVTLPTIDEDAATSEDLAAGTTILVGNLATGPLSLRLYARGLIYSDGAFPGADGHELRTVHDPWSVGTNVVYLGGSNPEGCRAAAQSLLGRIERADEITLPVTIDWVCAATNNPPLTDEQIARAVDDLNAYLRSFSGMAQYQSASGRPSGYARAYYLGGGESYARAYVALVRALREWYETQPDVDPPTFSLQSIVTALDQVEECPAMSDDERMMAAEWVRQIVDDAMGFWEMREPIARERDGVQGPTWNHQTHPAVGIAYAVEYFGSHFHMPQVDWWRRVVDNLFRGQETVYKPLEDSANYQWITINHTQEWALVRGEMTLFTSDTLRRTCELAIACHDNFGDEATFGDAWMPFGSNARTLMRIASLYYDDPHYRWLVQRLDAKARSSEVLGYWNWAGAAEEPRHQVGLTSFILAPEVYASYLDDNAAVGNVPPERALDKAVFRSGFDEQDSYLMLDGISTGIHDHDDANAIIRYTANGRLWLCDMDYIRATPKWHNSIMLSRDGETTPIPPLSELVCAADFGDSGMVQARAPQYAGSDWTRSVYWAGDRFVVFDELTALEPGDYRATCVWRTLGDVALAANRLDVEQQGEFFHIENADGARLSLRQTWDRGHGGDRGYYADYPYAGPMTQVLHQDRRATLVPGESLRFANVFSADQTAAPRVSVRTVAANVVAVSDGESVTVVGAGPWQQGNARIDAGMFALTRDSARFAGLHEVDLPGLQHGGEADYLAQGLPAEFAAWFDAVIAEAAEPPAPAALDRPDLPRELPVAWRADLGSPVICTDLWGVTAPAVIAAGTEDGRTVLLDADGGVVWERPAEAMVRAVRFIDINGDGTPELLSGADDAKLRAFDLAGELLWEVEIQRFHGRSGSVASICAAQLDDDPAMEVVIGSDNWHHYGFDGDGTELWRTDTTHACTVCAAGDIDGDGCDEVLAGSEYYGSKVLDQDGRIIGSVGGGPNWPACAAIDLNGDGRPEVLFGADDAIIRAQGAGGQSLWQANVGGAPTAIVGLSPNPAGAVVAASSESGSVYAWDGAGALCWRTELPEQVNGLATLNLELAAACDDGTVYLLGADGSVLGGYRAQGRPRALNAGDLRGAGSAAVIVAYGGELVALRVD